MGYLVAQLVLTNSLEEGIEAGDFEEFAPDYHWERQITEVGSNGLFQVDFMVFQKVGRGKKEVSESMSILMHKPGSKRRL